MTKEIDKIITQFITLQRDMLLNTSSIIEEYNETILQFEKCVSEYLEYNSKCSYAYKSLNSIASLIQTGTIIPGFLTIRKSGGFGFGTKLHKQCRLYKNTRQYIIKRNILTDSDYWLAIFKDPGHKKQLKTNLDPRLYGILHSLIAMDETCNKYTKKLAPTITHYLDIRNFWIQLNLTAGSAEIEKFGSGSKIRFRWGVSSMTRNRPRISQFELSVDGIKKTNYNAISCPVCPVSTALMCLIYKDILLDKMSCFRKLNKLSDIAVTNMTKELGPFLILKKIINKKL